MKTITRVICLTCGTDDCATLAAADRWADKHIRQHPDHDVRTPTVPQPGQIVAEPGQGAPNMVSLSPNTNPVIPVAQIDTKEL